MMIVNVEESGGNSFGGRIDRREKRRGRKHEKITITFPVIDIGSFTG